MAKVDSWKQLTLREKIGQTVICLCETEKHLEMCGSLEKFLEKYPIGGIFNNDGIVKGLMTGLKHNFKDILSEYNKYLRVPLWGTADFGFFASQNGLSIVPQMAVGATDDEKLAYKVGEYMAEDCKRSGIHWIFWPVCDMNMSADSPITNIRAVSDDPEKTSRIVKEEIRALRDNGIISTLKHYPGSPYNEYLDSHIAPCDNTTPIDMWRDTYGKVYRKLFEEGAPTVMTGHINLVDYQTEQIDEEYPPATMSEELTTKLLRQELGFKGVVVTDALVMGGFSGNKGLENMIRSFLSGNDVLLWPAYEYIDEMERRILSGEISEKILDEAVERIWNLKKEYGILDGIENSSEAGKDFFEERIKEVSEKCLTLVNDKYGLIPFDKNKVKNVLIVGVTPDDQQYEELCGLKLCFEQFGCNVMMQRNIWTDEVEKAAEEKDLIVFALCRTPHSPIGPLDFWGDEATSIWASNCSDKTKTVVVSFGTPYLYKYYKNSNVTYVNAYTPTPFIFESLVKALFGEILFEGKSSVQL